MATPTAAFQKIIGKRPWKVWKGFGSFLLFEFGRRKKDPKGNAHGEYRLWIYMASWRIKKGKRQIAHSESSDRLIERGAALLTGKRLDAVILNSTIEKGGVYYSARFWFDGGLLVQVFMYDDHEPSTIFAFHTPKTVLSYNYDGTLTEEEKSPNKWPLRTAWAVMPTAEQPA